jgi:hypothetical protein
MRGVHLQQQGEHRHRPRLDERLLQGRGRSPTIDFAEMGKAGERLGAYCAQNPSIGLITAADKLFDK